MSDPTADIIAWSHGDGRRIRGMGPLLHAYAERLRRGGVPVDRMTLSLRTLHPQVSVAAYFWTPETGITERTVPHGADLTGAYLNSPIRVVFEGAREVRRGLLGGDEGMDFPILFELREEGPADYLAVPAPFSDGLANAMTFATRRKEGFADAQVVMIRDTLEVLCPLIEIQAVRQLASIVLETYLGKDTGAKVLEGEIQRGHFDTIDAVLWFCDLRDFTGVSQRLPTAQVIELLNAYFGIIGAAVESHGGEILKFIGDAVLAIFPLDHGAGTAAVCANALAAAHEAIAARPQLDEEGGEAGHPVAFGIALHVGQAAYGNVGAPDRLDFTVIGPAVNLVSRIAGLCGELGAPLLASDAFAGASDAPLSSLGTFALKGIAEPQPAYGLPPS